MNNQTKAFNAPKNRFSLFLYYFLGTKQHLFHFLSLYIQKTQDFDSKLLKVHRAIQAQDSWSLTSGSLSR